MRLSGLIIFIQLIVWQFTYAQPACVENNCCCGDPIELSVPSGDFEDPPFANPIIVYFAGQNFGAWTVLSGSVDVLGPNYSNWAQGNPNGASQFIDLNGSTPGTMATTLNGLIAGYSYTLVLWYAKNAGASTANCQVEIANGAWLDETFTASNNGADGWLERCFEFTAQGTSAELRFTGSGGVAACGVLLDDISLWGCPADTEDPVVQNIPTSPLNLECSEPLPAPENLIVTDNCPGNINIVFTEDQSPQPCFFDLLRTWEVTDGCGNTITLEQVISVRDTEPPLFLDAPSDYVIACGGDYLAEFYDWIQNNGWGNAQDNCEQNVQWDADFIQEPDGLCGETPVTFTVTDGCGNSQSVEVSFIIADIDPPQLQTPAEDVTIYCAASPLDSITNWLIVNGGATATDPCGPVIWSNDFNGDINPAVIPVIFTATDACNNSSSSTAFFFQVTSSDTLFQTGTTCDPLLAGTDTVSVSVEDCETVTITTVTLIPADTLHLFQYVCDLQSAGSDTVWFTNQAGCDSLIITQSDYVPADTTTLTSSTCDPALAGTSTVVLQGSICDSIILTITSLLPSDSISLTLSTCDSLAAGSDTLLLTNQWGCDSTVYIQTIYTGQFIDLSTAIICGNGVPYSDTLVVTGGTCDSLFVTNYFYKALDTTYLSGSTCDPNLAGTTVQVVLDVSGCDSTIISTVLLLPADTTHVIGKVCDSLQANHDTLLLQNQAGCDSLVLIDIAYVGIDTQFVQQYSCDSAQVSTVVLVLPGPFCDTIRVVETLWSAFSLSRDTLYSCDPTGPATDTLVFSNSSGCDSLLIQHWYYTSPDASVQSGDETCDGFADGWIQVLNGSGGLAPYSYRIGSGSFQGQAMFSGLSPGVYIVEMMDGRGCTRIFSGVTIVAGEVLVVQAGIDQTVVSGAYVDLAVSANLPLALIEWQATDPIVCPSCPQTQFGPVVVDQTVTVQVISEQGCVGNDAMDVKINLRGAVYIPNSFSPNDDGINDFFSVYGNAQIAGIRRLAVYDRWGNAIYDQEDLPVNDPSAGWDGSFRDKKLDPGVYIYVIDVLFIDGSSRLYKGDVTLLRQV